MKPPKPFLSTSSPPAPVFMREEELPSSTCPVTQHHPCSHESLGEPANCAHGHNGTKAGARTSSEKLGFIFARGVEGLSLPAIGHSKGPWEGSGQCTKESQSESVSSWWLGEGMKGQGGVQVSTPQIDWESCLFSMQLSLEITSTLPPPPTRSMALLKTAYASQGLLCPSQQYPHESGATTKLS